MMAEGLMQLDAAFKEIDNHQELVHATLYGEAFNKLATRARPYLARIAMRRDFKPRGSGDFPERRFRGFRV